MKRPVQTPPEDDYDPFRRAEESPPEASAEPAPRTLPSKGPGGEPPTPLSAPKPDPRRPESGASDWMRPQPVRRESNIRAWLLFLAGIALIVGLWVPVRSAYQQYRYKPAVVGIRDADSFIALAYAGVSGGKTHGVDEVSRAQFAEHVRILRERGFNPIGLADVKEFYQNGRLLPRKAVLLTLE